MTEKQVVVVVSSIVADSYEARSYPNDQVNARGFYPLYRVPVYKIFVRGIDENNNPKEFEFLAPRFMPYFNDPGRPDPHYRTKGWVNAGLKTPRTVIVSRYKEDYEVQNRYSPGRGAIVVKGTFYIHAGPASLNDVGFGSAGCIEIIGDYNKFKNSIASLSGIPSVSSDVAIRKLIHSKKLTVIIQAASATDIKKSFTRMIHD